MTWNHSTNEDRITIVDRIIKTYMKSLSEEGRNEFLDHMCTLEEGDTYQFGLLNCVVTSKKGLRYLFDAILH